MVRAASWWCAWRPTYWLDRSRCMVFREPAAELGRSAATRSGDAASERQADIAPARSHCEQRTDEQVERDAGISGFHFRYP